MKHHYRLLIFLLLLIGNEVLAQSTYRRVKVNATEKEILQWQKDELLPAHYHYKEGVLEMELDPAELLAFKNKNIQLVDITETFLQQTNFRMAPAPANFTHGSMNGYYTLDEAMLVLDDMRNKFPGLVSKKDTIGYSFEGRPIVAIRISDNPDMVETEEDEWLMTGLHHANEVIGVSINIYFAWHLLENYESNKEIKILLNNSALYLVPVVNPDGLVFNESTNPTGGGTWRKNRKIRVIGATTHYGVDLNRNYDFKWGYSHPGQLGQAGSNFAGNVYYRGTAPWAETEVQAIRDLCNARKFTAAFNYHSWDDSFNYPWNFDLDSLTDDSSKFKAIAAYLTVENKFRKGTFNQTIGYSANGTSDDWMYGEQTTKPKIFAFTIEVGRSFWPVASLMEKYCDSLIPANIKMLRMAAKYAAIEETSAVTVMGLSQQAAFNLKRYSIKDTGFTVSLIPLDANIVSVGPDKLHTDISFLATVSDNIEYSLSPAIADGTSYRFLLKVDNGAWSYVDTITKVYRTHTTLPLNCDDLAEPNNIMPQATTIQPAVVTTASIAGRNDEDWFYFPNNENEKNIRVVLSDLPGDYDIELFTHEGKRVAYSSNPYKINDTIIYNTNEIGGFYLHVFGYKKEYHAFECYMLQVDLQRAAFAATSPAFVSKKMKATNDATVCPIPANDQLKVSLNNTIQGQAIWKLSDMRGKSLLSGTVNTVQGNTYFNIDVKMLAPGMYILNLQQPGNKGIQSIKVMRM